VIGLYSAAIAVGPGDLLTLLPGNTPPEHLYPQSRVIADPSRRLAPVARSEAEWLAAGAIPGAGTQYESLARYALLDMHLAIARSGGVVAGWAPPWRYVWPRDASFAAVALARTGHSGDALRILDFLQSVSRPGEEFYARYGSDGTPIRDGRGKQSDGTGWAMWALTEIARGSGATGGDVYRRYRVLLDGSSQTLLRLTNRITALPPPSPDYWETQERSTTLGTAATILLGLQRAAEAQRALGDLELAGQLDDRAQTLARTIAADFGPDYARYAGGAVSDRDAAIAFLLPPFQEAADPYVVRAWQEAQRCMARPAGGLAPGCGWRQDGVSWTPETLLFALGASESGDQERANLLLRFIATHTTSLGAIPEKVLRDGSPASVAPLAWSDALLLLTLESMFPSGP
jgi:GH15 family glucan-1,4-alpha-glucosidase